MPFEDDAAIVCNRDGKQEKLPMNRAVYQPPKRTQMKMCIRDRNLSSDLVQSIAHRKAIDTDGIVCSLLLILDE